ncbi:MAG: hypothetical protein COB81_05515 [Flavobacteriaceae bacterium]|nr:MAG: hypothetical protein COB81_05515 [Flavobacteriaceae bacterium]
MENKFDFSDFSKQSTRGILVYYFKILYKIIRVTWILVVIMLSKKSIGSLQTYFFIVLVAVLIYVLIRAILTFLNFKFKVSEHDFVLHKGIINKSRIAIPFEKIQNINFKQNLVQQLINVVEVEIETAGDKKVEIAITALSREKATALKNLLLSKTNQAMESMDDEQDGVIQQISVLELFKVSISENHFKSLLILLGLGFSLYVQVKDFFESLDLGDQLDVFISDNTDAVQMTVMLTILVVTLSFFIAILSSFFRVFVRHFNLTIAIRNGVLEIKQGLFTKRNNIIRKQKVQQLIVATNPLKKMLGISNVAFKQAISGKQKKGTVLHIVGTKSQQIKDLKKLIFSDSDFTNYQTYTPHFYYKRKMLVRSFIALLIINIIYSLPHLNAGWEWYLCNGILIPGILWMVRLKFEKCFFRLNKEMLWLGKGQVGSEYQYLECFKIQYVTLNQTIFQKRYQVYDMKIQTASGAMDIPCIPEEEAFKLYDYLIYKSQTATQPWM